jgi:hypothetical protein
MVGGRAPGMCRGVVDQRTTQVWPAPGGRPRGLRAVAGDRPDIIVQAAQEIDQHFLLIFRQARQQTAFPVKRNRDHSVMGGAAFRCKRYGMGTRVVDVSPDGDQAAFFHFGERAADGALVEPDHLADAGSGDVGLDRKQRHDPPLRDIDAEFALIPRGSAVRQLVRNEGDKRRNVAIEIERRTVLRLARFGRVRAWGHLSVRVGQSGNTPTNRDPGRDYTSTKLRRTA